MAKPLIKNPVDILLKEDYEHAASIEKDLKQFKQQSDPRFGDITIYQHTRSKQYLAAKELVVNDQKAAAELIVLAKQRLLQQHPNIVSVLDYSAKKQSELCATHYLVKYFYEYPHSDLIRESADRQRVGLGFSHEELTHYLFQQLLAQAFLEANGRFHGDVRPLYISVSKTEILSKLIDKSEVILSREKAKQLQAQHIISKDALYQSPALFENLKKSNFNFPLNQNKEDLFALGLVLLELGNQVSVQNLYALPKGAFDHDALNYHLNSFKNKFSGNNALLASTVAELLKPNEADRPLASELLGRMPDYQSVINFLHQNGPGQSPTNQTRSTNATPESRSVWVNAPTPTETRTSNAFKYFGQTEQDLNLRNPRVLDKSVEKPPVVPFKDANKTKVKGQPSPAPVSGPSPIRQGAVGKSIENPQRVLYLAPNAELEDNATYVKNNYKNYLGGQDQIVVERIYHKHVGPNQYEIEKSVNVLHKDGTVTQLPNDGQDKLAGAEKQVKVSATPPEFPKKNSVVNTSASPKPDKIKDKDKKEKDKKDKSPDAKKKDKPVEDGKRPSIGNPAEQRRSTSPNEKRESQPTANPKKDSTVSSQPKIDPAQHRDEPNKRGSTITGKDHGEPQKQDAQVSPHPEKRESQISGLAKDEHVKRDSSIDGKKPSILSIDIQRNSIGDANNDRRGSYPAPR